MSIISGDICKSSPGVETFCKIKQSMIGQVFEDIIYSVVFYLSIVSKICLFF